MVSYLRNLDSSSSYYALKCNKHGLLYYNLCHSMFYYWRHNSAMSQQLFNNNCMIAKCRRAWHRNTSLHYPKNIFCKSAIEIIISYYQIKLNVIIKNFLWRVKISFSIFFYLLIYYLEIHALNGHLHLYFIAFNRF